MGASPTPDEMVLIPGGPFEMGVDKEINLKKNMSVREKLKYAVSREGFNYEGPARTVTLDSFYIDTFEVSNKITNGELFWVIKVGINETGMPFSKIWKLES